MLNAREVTRYINCEQVESCKESCHNYGRNWSCPPYAKNYLEVKRTIEWRVQ